MDNNGMESMLDIYLFEANSLLEQLDEILLNCEKQGTFTTESVNEIFRIMHTVKGSSAMMQYNSLMTVSHKIEDLFYFIRENGLDDGNHDDLFDLMFQCSDFLKGEIEKVEKNESLTEDTTELVNDILSLLAKISGKDDAPKAKKSKPEKEQKIVEDAPKEIEEVVVAQASTSAETSSYGIKVFFDSDCQMENLRAFMLAKSIMDHGVELKYYPEDIQTNSETIETIVRDGFVMHFATEKDMRTAVRAVEQFIYVKDYSFIGEPEKKEEEKSTSTQNQVEQKSSDTNTVVTQTQAVAKQSLINVNLTKLDKLMNLVGEIVISESMITAIPRFGKVDMDNFSKATRHLAKLTDELQEIVMSIRMVPVYGVFQKMNRIVRDMSKKLNKEVNFQLIGEETEVDKTIVDNIGDPLMHLIRNAMDHGVETTEERIAAGKSPVGTVTLSAQNTGGEILICIEDDGKGMDPEKLFKKAKENGLVTKADNEYTKKEILSFILLPGFSTKANATEFSGRGVGMDVVKKNIEKVGGDISIESELGKGSIFTIKIPLTLSIVKGMEVSVADSTFTIPINNIRQSFKADDTNIMYDSNMREIVMIRDEYYPVIKLHEMYNIPTEITDIKDGILVLVEVDDTAYCVFADQLLGEHQVVVKPIPIYLNQYNIKDTGISGCAILGNGNITLILDMASLGNNL